VTGLGSLKRSLDVIVLNTLVWDVELKPTPTGDDPCGQMAFLERSLNESAASGTPVITIAHIPPGVDLFEAVSQVSGSSTFPLENVTYFWHDKYAARFRDMIRWHSAKTIRLMVFAHTHHEYFVADSSLGVPTLILGSISPIYGNMPNYNTLQLDDDTLVVNWSSMAQVALSGFAADATWNIATPTFNTLFGLSATSAIMTSAGIATTMTFSQMNNAYFANYYKRLCSDSATTVVWYKFAAAEAPLDATYTANGRLMTYCFATQLTRRDTLACFSNGCPSLSGATIDDGSLVLKLVAGIVAGVILVVLLFVIYRAWNQRKSQQNGTKHFEFETDLAERA